MSAYIKEYAPDDESAWNNYVQQHPEATVFHLAGWKRVIEQSMGYYGNYIMAYDNDRIAGIYPLFILSTGLFGTLGVSLPFVNYGGIVADNLQVEAMLTAQADKIGRAARCRYIELRQRFPLMSDLPLSERKVVSIIPLDGGPERVFERLHRNVRNKVRKARKYGIMVQQGTDYLPEFYDIYSRNLRDLGTPVLTRRFFEQMVDAFPDNVRVYRATRQGKTLGAKIILIYKDTCYFVWVASIREYLNYAPVHALNWAAIEDACAAGCDTIDFGRSTAESSHQEFKKYWGVESYTLPWAYQLLNCRTMPGLNKENPKYALFIAAWKKMPLFLSRILGPSLARRLP